MPLYEYECQSCEKRFEELRASRDADATGPCPSCGSEDIARQLSAFAAGEGSSRGTTASSCGSSRFR